MRTILTALNHHKTDFIWYLKPHPPFIWRHRTAANPSWHSDLILEASAFRKHCCVWSILQTTDCVIIMGVWTRVTFSFMFQACNGWSIKCKTNLSWKSLLQTRIKCRQQIGVIAGTSIIVGSIYISNKHNPLYVIHSKFQFYFSH